MNQLPKAASKSIYSHINKSNTNNNSVTSRSRASNSR